MAVTKTISNTFVVTTIEDGESQPRYIETQETWSNVASVASSHSEPRPNAGWYDYTPAKGSWTYLWRRSRSMTLNPATREYVAGIWTYQRLSGENGTSIKVKGTVATTSQLPSTHDDGDAYVVEADRHLYMWSSEAGSWVDLGEFKGESGTTYYTHIAWASDVTLGGNVPSRPDGQTTTPNASAVVDFSDTPSDGLTWMGVMVDINANHSLDDELLFTWQNTEGVGGTIYYLTANIPNITILSNSVSETETITARLWKRVGDENASTYNAWLGMYSLSTSGVRTLITSASNSSQITSQATATENVKCIEVYAWESQPTSTQANNATDYLARIEIPVLKWGDTGQTGQNAYLLTLDNDNDTIVIDNGGTQTIGSSPSIAKLWNGNTQISSSMTWDAMLNGSNIISDQTGAFYVRNDGSVTQSGSYVGNKFEIVVSSALTAGKYPIEIGCTYGGKRYTAIWNLNIVQGEDKYELDVMPDAVNYNSTTGTPSSTKISVRIYHTTAATERTQVTSITGDMRLRYYTSSATPSYSGGTALTLSGGVWSFNITSSAFSYYTHYKVVLWADSNTMLDSETINMVKVSNGANGANATTYEINTNIGSVTIPSDAVSTTIPSLTGAFYMTVGSNQRTAATMYYVVAYRLADGTYSTIGNLYNNGSSFSLTNILVNVTQSAISVFIYDNNTYTSSNYYQTGVWLERFDIPIVANGSTGPTGPKGDIGRAYYYDGEYDNSKGYELTETQAPFVSYNGKYWVRYGANGSTTTDTPSSSSNDWREMVSDFKYLISEAMFTNFAKLGSAVFNRDWMYSQYSNAVNVLFNGSQQCTTQTWTQVGNAFNVRQGVSYSVYITGYCSSSEGAYFKVFYGNADGKPRLLTMNTSSTVHVLNFVSEVDGTANIRVYCRSGATCTITRIAINGEDNYNAISPSFMNGEPCVLYYNTDGMTLTYNTDTSARNYIPIVNAPVYLIANKSYKVTIIGRKASSSSSNFYVSMRFVGGSSDISSTSVTFSNYASNSTKTFTVTPTTEGWAYPVWAFSSSNSNNNSYCFYLAVEAVDPFVPMVAVDWLTGYAHFGGGNARFQPNGDVYVAGTLRAKSLGHSFTLCQMALSGYQSVLLPSQGGTNTWLTPSHIVYSSLWDEGTLPSKLVLDCTGSQGGRCEVYMPPAQDYIGQEIEIFNTNISAHIMGGSSSSGNLFNITFTGNVKAILENGGRVRLMAVRDIDNSTYGWVILDYNDKVTIE